MARIIPVPKELMQFFSRQDGAGRFFNAIQHYFAQNQAASAQTGSFKIVRVITAAETTPTPTEDELFVDTDTGNKQINLPKGPNGKSYRICNVGSSGNRVILALEPGAKLFGTEQGEYLSDAETLIITFESTQGWW